MGKERRRSKEKIKKVREAFLVDSASKIKQEAETKNAKEQRVKLL